MTGSWKAPVAKRGTGAVAAGVAAALLLCVLALAGCADVRQSGYFPETVSVGSSFGRVDGMGWDRETVGVSFTWRLKPRVVIPIPPPTASPSPTPDTDLP